MENIIISIITAIIGIAFLSWGIYQIKTGKMVAKRAKRPIDEPRQVGILFLLIGFEALWFTLFFAINFTEKIIFYIALLIFCIFILVITIYGLKNHRIFGIKNTQKIAKYTKKYYIFTNLSLIILLIPIIIINFFGSSLSPFTTIILLFITLICVATSTATMLLIEYNSYPKK